MKYASQPVALCCLHSLSIGNKHVIINARTEKQKVIPIPHAPNEIYHDGDGFFVYQSSPILQGPLLAYPPSPPPFFALLGRPWAERELQWMHMCNIFCRSIKCLFLIGFLEQSEGLIDGQTRILFDECSAVYNISVFSCHLVRAPIYLTPANRVYQVVMNDRY